MYPIAWTMHFLAVSHDLACLDLTIFILIFYLENRAHFLCFSVRILLASDVAGTLSQQG